MDERIFSRSNLVWWSTSGRTLEPDSLHQTSRDSSPDTLDPSSVHDTRLRKVIIKVYVSCPPDDTEYRGRVRAEVRLPCTRPCEWEPAPLNGPLRSFVRGLVSVLGPHVFPSVRLSVSFRSPATGLNFLRSADTVPSGISLSFVLVDQSSSLFLLSHTGVRKQECLQIVLL